MKRLTALLAALGALLFAAPALGQSSPGFVMGQVPTAAQWNGYFAGKQDYYGTPGTAALQNIGTSGATVPLLNGSNTWGALQAFPSATFGGYAPITTQGGQTIAGALNVQGTYSQFGNVTLSNIAPTIASGFGTSPSIVDSNGGVAFRLNVGTGGTASSGTVTLAAATHAWVCEATDVTTTSATVFLTKQTAATTTSATFTNYSTSGTAAAWAAGDVLYVKCVGE